MTDQQYRLIKDRDKGDDPQWDDVAYGDRYYAEMTDSGDFDRILRIERPVPTVDGYCPDCGNYGRAHGRVQDMADGPMRDCRYKGVDFRPQHPSVPTREQIAAVIEVADSEWMDEVHPNSTDRDWRLHLADAVHALIQKGTGR